MMEATKDSTTTTSLTPADVEVWLDDNVDWLCDYLQRRKSILRRTASLSRHTVPAQCRSESTLSPWHSRTHTISVEAMCDQTAMTSSTSRMTSSPHHYHRYQHQQQVQRGVTLPTRTTDHTTPSSTPSSNLFIVTAENTERPSSSPSLLLTADTTPQNHSANSKKHLRRHFARSKLHMTQDEFAALTNETSSASFDWFVSHALLFCCLVMQCSVITVLCIYVNLTLHTPLSKHRVP